MILVAYPTPRYSETRSFPDARKAPDPATVLLATIAGFFYGNAFRTRQRLSAAALTRARKDTVWYFWF